MADRVLAFMDDESGYDDGKAADISKDAMGDKEARKKVKKDLEMKLGRRLRDSEWAEFEKTGVEPVNKKAVTPSYDANLSDMTDERNKLLKGD